MKGFIEVTNARAGAKQLININRIRGVSGPDNSDGEFVADYNGAIAFDEGVIPVRESYDELKALIAEALSS